MKHTILHYIYVLLAGTLFFPAMLQGIRISPQEISVRNDSLQLFLEMDLNDVHVNNLTSVSFTLVLQAVKNRTLWWNYLLLSSVAANGSALNAGRGRWLPERLLQLLIWY